MEYPDNTQFLGNYERVNLTNSTAVLVLGIISIVSCWCYGVVGIICGIIAIVLSKKDLEVYYANPNSYTLSSFNNLKAGKICGIIGLSCSILYLIFTVVYIVLYGTLMTMQGAGAF